MSQEPSPKLLVRLGSLWQLAQRSSAHTNRVDESNERLTAESLQEFEPAVGWFLPRFRDPERERKFLMTITKDLHKTQSRVATLTTLMWIMYAVSDVSEWFVRGSSTWDRYIAFQAVAGFMCAVVLMWSVYVTLAYASIEWRVRHAQKLFLFIGFIGNVRYSLSEDRVMVLVGADSWSTQMEWSYHNLYADAGSVCKGCLRPRRAAPAPAPPPAPRASDSPRTSRRASRLSTAAAPQVHHQHERIGRRLR